MARSVSLADVVFDPFGIDPRGLFGNPQCQQEGFHDLVLAPSVLGHFPAFVGKEDRAVGLLRDQFGLLQPFQGLDHRRVGDAEPQRDIGTPRLALLVDQVGDQLHIVLEQLRAVVRPDAPERGRSGLGGAGAPCALRHVTFLPRP